MALKTNPLNHYSFQHWDTCFVLFAAEWWKRNYEEGPWTWTPIESELQISNFNPNTRSLIVERGCKALRIGLAESSKKYIGAVALSSGIPTKTLSKGAWLSKLIKNSYEEYIRSSSSSNSLIDSIRYNASRNSPETFRIESFYQLIELIIVKLSYLKKKYSLGKQNDPINVLDQQDSSWRNDFPISIDSNEGVEFLNALLTEIARIREIGKYPISMEWELIDGGNNWSIDSVIKFPKGEVYLDDLRITDDKIISKIESSSRIAILLFSDEGLVKELGITIPGRKTDGQVVIEFPRGISLKGVKYSVGYRIVVASQGSEIAVLPLASALNNDVPWSFVMNEGKYILKSLASFNSHSDEVLTVVPFDYEILEGQPIKLGKFDDWGIVYRVSIKTVLRNFDKGVFKIDVKYNQSDNYNYILRGKNYLPEYIKTNQTSIFYGKPKLLKEDTESTQSYIISNGIHVRPKGSLDWQDWENIYSGQYGIRLVENGFTLFQDQIFILPERFEIQVIGNITNSISGEVRIKESSEFDLRVFDGECQSSIEKSNSDKGYCVKLKALTNIPPESLSIKLSKSNGSELLLTIPFPSSGVQIFRNGVSISRSETLYFLDLRGVRIKFYNNPNQNARYRVSLQAESNQLRASELSFEMEVSNVDTYVTEISLIGLREEMNMLFGAVPDLDKSILLEVYDANGRSLKRNRIRVYSNQLTVENSTGILKSDYTNNPPNVFSVSAFRLDIENAGSDPLLLSYEKSVDGFCWESSNWSIIGQEGLWFLYPPVNSIFLFRPMVAIPGQLKNHKNTLNSIKDVAGVRVFDDRLELLVEYIDRIAFDFDNPDWKEIDWLWKNTNHLPMAALDVWTAFSKSQRGIVGLFLKEEWQNGLFEKILTEFPILLETVCVDIWLDGIKSYKKYWIEKLGSETSDILINAKSKLILEKLKLVGVKEIISVSTINKAILSHIIDSAYTRHKTNLFGVNTSLPDGDLIRDELINAEEKLPNLIRESIPAVSHNKYKPIIYLPFVLAYKSIYPNVELVEITSKSICKIKKLISLNQEWFRDAFDFTQLFIWSEKTQKE